MQRDEHSYATGDSIFNTQLGVAQTNTSTNPPQQSWQLANNAPRLSTSARDSITTWSDGDIIVNTTMSAIQVRIAGAWKSASLT